MQNMFEQMMGTSEADIEVISPKMAKMYNYMIKTHKVLNVLTNFDGFWGYFPHHQHWKAELNAFLEGIVSSLDLDLTKEYTGHDFLPEEYQRLLDPKVDLELYRRVQEATNKRYGAIKENEHIRHIVDSADNLAQFKAALIQVYMPKEERERRQQAQEKKDPNAALDVDIILPEQTLTMKPDEFIYKEPGSLKPLTFTSLDLKYIWSEEQLDLTGRKMILKIMSHIYWIGIDIYDLVTSPDVDIKQFSAMLIEAISSFKRKIPRCQNAFRIIEKSVHLLEKNFKRYYRDAKSANNSNLIMEMFILEVAQTQDADPKVLIEFKTIINYLRKKVNKVEDPRIKSLLKMLDNNFEHMKEEMKKEDIELMNELGSEVVSIEDECD